MTTNDDEYQRHWSYDAATIFKQWAFVPTGMALYNPFGSEVRPVYRTIHFRGGSRDLVFRSEEAFDNWRLNGGVMQP